MKHKHHIIPRYEGGSDFAENIVELTVTQHAMWHFAEWQRKGLWQDKVAWQGLAGIIGHEEAVSIASSEGSRLRDYERPETIQKLKAAWTEERKAKHSRAMAEKWKDQGAKIQETLSNLRRSSPHTQLAKQRMSRAKKGRKWWNDGKEQCMSFECPDGWVHGRLR